MDGLRNSGMKVLVVEDSRPDRLRFRSILEMAGADFNFAWDARNQEVPGVDEIMGLIKVELKPSILFLDLAWTIDDDRILQRLLFKSLEEIEGLRISLENENSDDIERCWFSGYRLLEKLRREEDLNLKIYVTTQYVPPVAYGLREYLWNEFSTTITLILHKWRHEKRLMSLI